MSPAVEGSSQHNPPLVPTSMAHKVGGLVGWVVLVTASFFGAQYFVAAAVFAIAFTVNFVSRFAHIGAIWQFDPVVSQLAYRLAVYIVMVAMIGAVVWYRYRKLTLGEAGLSRLPEWGDIGLSLAGVVVYMLTSAVALKLASNVPGFNLSQPQDLNLPHLFGSELMAAFVVFVVLTPLFEEAIFRGFLYGRLRGLQFPWWLSAIVVSLLFGAAHMQWNVGVDVFCLSMVACILREMTGSIWAGVLLHIVKNFIAFLFTFVFVNGVIGL